MLSHPVKIKLSSFTQLANFSIKAFPIYLVLLKEILNYLNFGALFTKIFDTISPLMFGRLDNPSSSN